MEFLANEDGKLILTVTRLNKKTRKYMDSQTFEISVKKGVRYDADFSGSVWWKQ